MFNEGAELSENLVSEAELRDAVESTESLGWVDIVVVDEKMEVTFRNDQELGV